jgi:hypothetical protein
MSQPEKSAVRILWQSTIRPWRVLFDDHDVADAQLRRRPVDGILKIVCPPADAQDAGPSDGGRHSDSALRSNARDAVTIFGSRQLTDHPRAIAIISTKGAANCNRTPQTQFAKKPCSLV